MLKFQILAYSDNMYALKNYMYLKHIKGKMLTSYSPPSLTT